MKPITLFLLFFVFRSGLMDCREELKCVQCVKRKACVFVEIGSDWFCSAKKGLDQSKVRLMVRSEKMCSNLAKWSTPVTVHRNEAPTASTSQSSHENLPTIQNATLPKPLQPVEKPTITSDGMSSSASLFPQNVDTDRFLPVKNNSVEENKSIVHIDAATAELKKESREVKSVAQNTTKTQEFELETKEDYRPLQKEEQKSSTQEGSAHQSPFVEKKPVVSTPIHMPPTDCDILPCEKALATTMEGALNEGKVGTKAEDDLIQSSETHWKSVISEEEKEISDITAASALFAYPIPHQPWSCTEQLSENFRIERSFCRSLNLTISFMKKNQVSNLLSIHHLSSPALGKENHCNYHFWFKKHCQ